MQKILVLAALSMTTACSYLEMPKALPTPDVAVLEPCKEIVGFEQADRLVIDSANLMLDYAECAGRHEALANIFR